MAKATAPKKKPPIATGDTLLIAAGGTGGHINPGVSIAETWLQDGGRVIFATLGRNLDYPDIITLARNEAVTIVAYDAPKLTINPLKIVAFLKRFRAAYRLIRQVARGEKAVAVLGMGGYSSFPAVAYAFCNRVPLFLCEQNARWGIVTRIARFIARRIFLSFAPSARLAAKYIVTGNPLRSVFSRVKRPAVKSAKAKQKTIFFVGGSQGAHDINALYRAFAAHPDAKKYRCIVSAGPAQHNEVKAYARKIDDIRPFVTDMPETLIAADYAVARCGSGTLFELVWAGKPAFLLPYPHAAADHQRANAEAIRHELPCEICDIRPFDVATALAALLHFLRSETLPKVAQNTAAQQQIARYIKEALP